MLLLVLLPGVAFGVSNIIAGQQYGQDSWGGQIIVLDDNADDGVSSNGPEGVLVTNSQVTGKMYLENYGWLELQPENGGVNLSVQEVGGVLRGELSGFAWGENIGWVDFGDSEGEGAVYIDNNGYFHGFAWTEMIGWLAFGGVSDLTSGFWPQTTWRPSLQVDQDQDGVSDINDIDVDGDGILNTDEFSGLDPIGDVDSDGTQNFEDPEFIGPDGISCSDIDLDGVCEMPLGDTDGDGVPDFKDLDSDNDAVSDVREVEGLDGNNDGVLDDGSLAGTTIDNNNDGLDDSLLGIGINPTNIDTDSDSIPNVLDVDDDGDGILTIDEDVDQDGDPTNDDADTDTTPNYLDLDSDDDGVYDVIESGGDDGNGDGMADDGTPAGTLRDIDSDGLDDSLNGNGSDPSLQDEDSDGNFDFVDVDNDSDDDGFPNNVEKAEGTNPNDILNFPTSGDSDGDLVPDIVEGVSGSDGVDINSYKDEDKDGVADFIETITPNSHEGSGDGNPDTDQDGVPDYIELIAGTDPVDNTDIPADTDGDGVPDVVELNQGTNPNSATGPNNYIDDDGDSVPDYIEVYARNRADENNDAELDSEQGAVASYVNPIVAEYNSFTVSGECHQIELIKSRTENELLEDEELEFPVGLWDYQISCINSDTTPNIGATAIVKIYLDKLYDTTDWVFYKYNGSQYDDISEIITYGTHSIGGDGVTTITYSITDGGLYDQDGVADGTIIDPSGPGIVFPPTDIELTNNTINAGEPSGTLIGILSTTDESVNDSHTYSLSCAVAGPDDGLISLAGDIVNTAIPFDVASPADADNNNQLEVCIVSRDSTGQQYEEILTFAVINALDSDGDGMPDNWENDNGLNPNNASDAIIDTDQDGLLNIEEFNGGINSTDPQNPDTDGDSLTDGFEVKDSLTDPNDIDSDSSFTRTIDENDDGITDPNEDYDGDGLNNFQEMQFGSHPFEADSDNDGLNDSEERQLGTDPERMDSDGDGMTDACERQYGFNPTNSADGVADLDGDGRTNSYECLTGTDPRRYNATEEPDPGINSSGKAALREWCIGKTREECAKFITGLKSSDRENFDKNYARSLEIAQEINEGREKQKITYVDAYGRERFAGFIKGKRAADAFARAQERLIYRRHVVRENRLHASADNPNFMPVFGVSAFKDVDYNDNRYIDLMVMDRLQLLDRTDRFEMKPRSAMQWNEIIEAMLWIREIPVATYDDLANVPTLDNVVLARNHASRVYYTAFKEKIIRRSFDPRAEVTRGAALKMMAIEYGLDLENLDSENAFSDISPDHDLFPTLQAAHTQDWFDRMSERSFRPNVVLDRQTFASVFVASLGLANPLLDTPAFNSTVNKLQRLYDDVYQLKETEIKGNTLRSSGTRSINETGLEDLSEAELKIRGRRLKNELEEEKKNEGPSTAELEQISKTTGIKKSRIKFEDKSDNIQIKRWGSYRNPYMN